MSFKISGNPAAGDTYMRVTDGSVSARFQALRLPMGAGLGGLVAQTAAPYATARYFADPRFQHTDEINGGVAEEGLVAILGVPLVRGSRVIGVLFAADRNERLYDRSEVSLLGSLAEHAAVALDNARLLEETRSALEELSTATRELRAHTASVERAAGAHDRFIDIVLRGGGVERFDPVEPGVEGGVGVADQFAQAADVHEQAVGVGAAGDAGRGAVPPRGRGRGRPAHGR